MSELLSYMLVFDLKSDYFFYEWNVRYIEICCNCTSFAGKVIKVNEFILKKKHFFFNTQYIYTAIIFIIL